MKRTLAALLLLLLTLALLAACGDAAAPDSGIIRNVERSEDTISVELCFDQSYEDVSVNLHAQVDSDTFAGDADFVSELGVVEAGQTYTVEAPTKGDWYYSGAFKNVSSSSLSAGLVPPDLSGETVQITVSDGETELEACESTP